MKHFVTREIQNNYKLLAAEVFDSFSQCSPGSLLETNHFTPGLYLASVCPFLKRSQSIFLHQQWVGWTPGRIVNTKGGCGEHCCFSCFSVSVHAFRQHLQRKATIFRETFDQHHTDTSHSNGCMHHVSSQDSQSKIICIYLKVTIVAAPHFIHSLRQAVVPHKQQSDRPIHRYPVI